MAYSAGFNGGRPHGPPVFETAIVCAHKFEFEAVDLMFEHDFNVKLHDKLPANVNRYTLGRIHQHNVLLVHMAEMGEAGAAQAAANLCTSLPNVQLTLLIGVCSGVPTYLGDENRESQVFLGDAIIGTRIHQFGEESQAGSTGTQSQQATEIALSDSIASFLEEYNTRRKCDLIQDEVHDTVAKICQNPRNEAIYRRPTSEHDILFAANYIHRCRSDQKCAKCQSPGVQFCPSASEASCEELRCDRNRRIDRKRYLDDGGKSRSTRVHFGPFTSDNIIARRNSTQDSMNLKQKVIAFDKEGAGAWNSCPMLFVKGVNEYADSHKTKHWQCYAALVAAATAKALLKRWPLSFPRHNSFMTENDRSSLMALLKDVSLPTKSQGKDVQPPQRSRTFPLRKQTMTRTSDRQFASPTGSQQSRSSPEHTGDTAAADMDGGQPFDPREPIDFELMHECLEDFPFGVLSNSTCQIFVRIPLYMPETRLQFLSKHSDLYCGADYLEIQASLFRQAEEFATIGRDDAAHSCIFSLATLLLTQRQNIDEVPKFFRALSQEGRAASDLKKIVDQLKSTITKNSGVHSKKAISRGSKVDPQTTNPRVSGGPPLSTISQLITESRAEQVATSADNDSFGTLTWLSGPLELDQVVDKSGDPSASRNPRILCLEAVCRRRDGAWYQPGRVFAILWHSAYEMNQRPAKVTDELMEPAEKDRLAPDLDPISDPDLHNSTFYSYLRYFIVVRNRSFSNKGSRPHSRCVGIGTYAGYGLTKRGLKDDDINEHLIVYGKSHGLSKNGHDLSDSLVSKNEPRSNKRPIEIKLAEGAALDRASRVHLAKVYTVSHALKVMDIGNIAPADLQAFIKYVDNLAFL